MRKLAALAVVAGLAGAASADVVISEILGSTSGTDWEYIEIVNLGAAPVDITGWTLELWDSDAGASFGAADGSSPYAFNGTLLNPGDTFVIGNGLAMSGYPQPPYRFDQAWADNSVENSSYTAVLADAASAVADAVFVTDGGAGDAPNRAGAGIAPSMTVGPDDTFLPAGFARTDAVGGHAILYFDTALLADGTIEGGTPGINQIPAPGALALLSLGGLGAIRRRR
ncbi:MAG TPA: lamin tail domain-containing protein [Phycisphaerales bacterium]|nr:lamin tail domain-containing protein [Phycisphaerales bacterium]